MFLSRTRLVLMQSFRAIHPVFVVFVFFGLVPVRDGDTKVACILHAHLLLLFKNLGVDDVNKTVASVVLSAQVCF